MSKLFATSLIALAGVSERLLSAVAIDPNEAKGISDTLASITADMRADAESFVEATPAPTSVAVDPAPVAVAVAADPAPAPVVDPVAEAARAFVVTLFDGDVGAAKAKLDAIFPPA